MKYDLKGHVRQQKVTQRVCVFFCTLRSSTLITTLTYVQFLYLFLYTIKIQFNLYCDKDTKRKEMKKDQPLSGKVKWSVI